MMNDARWEAKKEDPHPARPEPNKPTRSPDDYPEIERSPDRRWEDDLIQRRDDAPRRGGDDPTTDW